MTNENDQEARENPLARESHLDRAEPLAECFHCGQPLYDWVEANAKHDGHQVCCNDKDVWQLETGSSRGHILLEHSQEDGDVFVKIRRQDGWVSCCLNMQHLHNLKAAIDGMLLAQSRYNLRQIAGEDAEDARTTPRWGTE